MKTGKLLADFTELLLLNALVVLLFYSSSVCIFSIKKLKFLLLKGGICFLVLFCYALSSSSLSLFAVFASFCTAVSLLNQKFFVLADIFTSRNNRK